MKRGFPILVALFLVLLLAACPGAHKSIAAEVNILPYFVAGSPGDTWTYAYTFPVPPAPDFTNSLLQITSGQYIGKYFLGKAGSYQIFDWNAGGVNIYATESKVYDPPAPVEIAAMQTLDTVVISPFPEHGDFPWYFQKLSKSLTVLAGTFDNVLLHIALDKNFGPTGANTKFGLDPSIIFGVTHVSWMAPGIGEIQNRDYDEFGNIPYEYQLKATTVIPLPPSALLLGSALLALLIWRDRT